MTFKDSLYTVTRYLIPRLILPDWAMPLSKKTRDISLGFNEWGSSALTEHLLRDPPDRCT
jgi:hypothetical protein